jgi:serine/threonine-protein kinase
MASIAASRIGSRLVSPVTGKQYTIDAVLGVGGFGRAYRAKLGRRHVCLKVTTDSASWHREAYIGELLDGHPRVVRLLEAFPLVRPGGIEYAIAMELAEGTVADAIEEDGPWSERRAVREVRGLLSAVARLHDSGAVHRDITPFNVFVCGPKRALKLGDFGIARHGAMGKGVRADAFAPWFVDTDIDWGSRQRWTFGDDLWQVGQIAVVLLTGELRPIRTREVKELDCSDGLKLAIRRAIGEPSQRFSGAQAMADALAHPHGLTFSRLSTLRGRTLVFTGPLPIRRAEAERRARKAGAAVLDEASGRMDVLVVGNESPRWIAGSSGGVKVLETMALQERGYPIKMITGHHFARLVGMR